MARVLLYNFTNEDRRKKIKMLLFQYAIPSQDVYPIDQGRPLGSLLGMEGIWPMAESGEPFNEEMIVMHDLNQRQFNGFVDGLRRQGVIVPLKAVVTEHNVGWSSWKLCQELKAEHEAMVGGAGKPFHQEK